MSAPSTPLCTGLTWGARLRQGPEASRPGLSWAPCLLSLPPRSPLHSTRSESLGHSLGL